jgi:integrating conjugative element protein (TIGR03757 family)
MRVRTLATALTAVVMQQTALAEGAAALVEVFTLSTLPLANSGGTTVYYVDSVVLLEQHLSANLPSDPRQAQAIATQRVAVLGPQLRARVGAGAAGLARAAQLGVDRAPAVVFDGQWVVYGITDIDTARRIFDAKTKHVGSKR